MKLKITHTAAAVLIAASSTVQAKADASAALSDLIISVEPISTVYGAATPSVLFTSGSDYLEINSQTQFPLTYQYSILGTPGFFAASALSTTPAYAGAQATIQGDPFSGLGGSVSASSFAYGTAGQLSTASAQATVGDQATYASFTLGPNTRLNVTAVYEVSASVGGGSFAPFNGAYEFASFTAGLTLLPAMGQPGEASFQDLGQAVARAGYYVDSPYFDQGVLSVSYTGSESSSTSGQFMASVTAMTLSNVPIPEPTNAALMLAGLGALGWICRRSASSADGRSSMSMHAVERSLA